MNSKNHARRFTDVEYLSKNQIGERVGQDMMDSIWKTTNEYREKYRFALDLKRNDFLPVSIVLTPSIMSLANSAERLLFQYSATFNKQSIYQSLSDNKTLNTYKEKMLTHDLLLFAHNYGVATNANEVTKLIGNYPNSPLKNTQIYGILKALEYLINSPKEEFDQNLINRVYTNYFLIESPYNILMYRDIEIGSMGYNSIGVPPNRIAEHMEMLFDFIRADYEMSPIIVGAIVFAYLNYIIPFTNSTAEISLLLMQKIIADLGYGEVSYFTHATQFFLQSYKEMGEVLDEVRKTGDLTYAIVFVAKTYHDAVSFSLKDLAKVPLPQVYEGGVKVVEKIVEKTIEVPIETIVEVPVEVEKIVYVERIQEQTSQPQTQHYQPPQPGHIGVNTNLYAKEQEEITSKEVFNFADKDPFFKEGLKKEEVIEEKQVAEIRAEPLEVKEEMPQPKPQFEENLKPEVTQVVEKVEIVEVKPEPKVIKGEVPIIEEIELEKINLEYLKKLEGLDAESYAHQLMQLNPNIRPAQASFYAEHRQPNRFYTISQFRHFSDCAYETARTSMDFLAEIGLYEKRGLKNKYIYTPVTLEEENKEE